MSLQSLYADRIEEGIQRQLRSPGMAPGESSFSLWGALVSGVSAVPAGGLETTGSVADMTSAFGTALASTGGSSEGMFSTGNDRERQQTEAARQKMLDGQLANPAIGNELRRKADEFAPNPETAHKADQVIHGVVRGLTKAVGETVALGPVAGPVAFGLDEGNTTYQRLRETGVDAGTAAKVGAIQGAVSGVTAGIPVVGQTVAKTVALGAGSGPIAYMAQEQASKKILERAGYKDLASMHDPLDPLGLTLSTLMPLALAGIHARSLRGTTLPDVVKHIESGGKRYAPDGSLLTSPKGAQGEMQVMPKTATDPGFGVTPAKDNSPDELARVGRDYLAAMEQRYGDSDKALAAYNAGPGAVDAAITAHGPNWLQHLPEETRKYVTRANQLMGEHAVEKASANPEAVDAARVAVTQEAFARSLPDHPEAHVEALQASDILASGRMPEVDQAEIGARLQQKLMADHEAAVREYASRPDAEGGKVLNTDVARELSPEYLRDRTQSAAVHEPASAFVKRMYEERLAQIKPGDEVMFTSGGTGAGKTSAISGIGAIATMKRRSAIVYDTNMNTLSSAVKKIDQALEAGASVNIVHVQRDPVDALVNGSLPRAMRQEREFGTGRTVPLNEHARTHRGAAEVIQQIAERYKDNPNVAVRVIDNTKGKGGQRVADLGFVRKFDYNGIEGRLHEALKQEYDAGRISEAVRRGSEDGSVPRARNPVRAADGAEPARADLRGEAQAGLTEKQPADLARVRQLSEQNPDLTVRLPGETENTTVAEALARAEEAAKVEKQEADLLKAALDCALSFA